MHILFYYFCKRSIIDCNNLDKKIELLQAIRLPIKDELAAFKGYYDALFDTRIPLLSSAMEHVSSSVGKMMRPMLLFLVAKSCGGITDAAYPAASSLEMLHTASLLHDDVVDESDVRRGSPSLNALFGNRVAILTGDYLFSLALNSAAKTNNIEVIERISMLGQALSSGELLQLHTQKVASYDEENYFRIIKEKTASLFAACAYIGALSTGADSAVAANMQRVGELIGICFQIKDDIFDYYESDIGKPTGSDMLEGKITLPALYVLRTCTLPSLEAIKEKLYSHKELDEKDIELLTGLSKSEGGVEYAMNRIYSLRDEALSLLPSSIQPDCRAAFEAYFEYVISRDK